MKTKHRSRDWDPSKFSSSSPSLSETTLPRFPSSQAWPCDWVPANRNVSGRSMRNFLIWPWKPPTFVPLSLPLFPGGFKKHLKLGDGRDSSQKTPGEVNPLVEDKYWWPPCLPWAFLYRTEPFHVWMDSLSWLNVPWTDIHVICNDYISKTLKIRGAIIY